MDFVFHEPDPPCPPASALARLPAVESHELVDPRVVRSKDSVRSWCTYQHVDGGGRGQDTVTADHVQVTSQTTLYRDWADSDWPTYPALPIESDDLEAWSVAARGSGDRDVWWEGCGAKTACAKGEAPTVRTYVWRTRFEAHVGNLEFYVHIAYIAEVLPPDVETRNLEVFRDLVRAVVADRERAD